MVGLQNGKIIVYDAGQSSYDEDGVRTETQTPAIIFESSVSWQEGLRTSDLHEFEAIDGLNAKDVDYTVYLGMRKKINQVKIGAKCDLIIGDETYKMTVLRKRKLDAKIYLMSL